MELLALDDPVFVVDLGPEALAACRADLAGTGTELVGTDPGSRQLPAPPEQPIRAVALLLEPGTDPVLVPVEPTRDVAALDAAARLLRVALVTGITVGELAREHGDAPTRALYLSRRLPAFIYRGLPPRVLARVPPGLLRCVP